MLGKGNGKIKATQHEVPVEDMAIVGADLATFTMACLIGDGGGLPGVMVANNILIREVNKYGDWKKAQVVWVPSAAEAYLQEMHMRLYQELGQLAAIGRTTTKKEESNAGSGYGPQGGAESDGKQDAGDGAGDPKLVIA